MKRLILSTLCALLCITGALAKTLVDGIYYNFDESTHTASVTGQGSDSYSGDIVIPSIVAYNGTSYNVTSIESQAFGFCSELTSVKIPNSVTSIGSFAFDYCENLIYNTYDNAKYLGNDDNPYLYLSQPASQNITSCEINENCKIIASCAFTGCTKLASIEIPNSVINIGDYAFKNCNGLTSITIGNGVANIGRDAFAGCNSLTYNTYNNAMYLGSSTNPYIYLHKGASNDITSCEINENCTTIESWAFYNCSILTNITIPNSVINIGAYAFINCDNIETADINSQVALDSIWFSHKLTSIVLGNDITSIEHNKFYGCSGLTSITIPSSVTSIGYGAFDYCNKLAFNILDNAKYLGNGSNPYLFLYKSESQDITRCEISSNCKFIADYAFQSCNKLTSIAIPNSVTSIGSDAFSGCDNIETADINSQVALDAISFTSNLVNITLGNDVTKIESNKFRECPNLMSVTINEGVTSIGRSAFYRCSGLTSVTIPNSVTSIGDNAFYKCTGLKEVINKSALNITKGSTDNGYVAYYADYVCNGGKTVIDDFIFSDRDKTLVKYIGDGGDITLPEDFNGEEYTVGANMFDGSTGLTSIIVPCDRYDYFKGAITRYSSIVYGNCTFEVKTNVNNENYGTVTESGIFKKGQTLQITATPSEHYHFVKWNDNNTQNPRTVQVTQDSTFTAVFAIDEHYVFINKNISDAGTVTGDGVYEYNTTVQLTATANEGYRFKGWSDGVMDASREITVTKDTSITANFVALYTIKALASASQGSVSGGGVYEDGETATLVANAKPGYVFAQWADGNDENPRYVTVDGNKTYTAIFIEGEQDKYMITWKNWDGRVIKTSEVSYGEVPAFDGEKPTRPDEAGYTFTFNGWSPTIAAASQNAEYTANYIQTATEAEKTTIGDEETVNIATTDNTALFTWPENASADTYTLTITRNDEVFCSLTFDGQGRLINLNFPNLRASAEGYQFTVTGLNSGTDYAYDLKAKNGAATVSEYTGEFRTSGDAATAAPEAEESIVETARYDINGRPLNAPVKGVNIVKYSDGSFEKEFVK